MIKKKTDKEIQQDKTESLMNAVNLWCGYFRANPSRFIEMWIPSIKLKPFQKILLWAMAHNDMAVLIASRGLGKTYILAMYGVFKCINYPGTHMVCVSHTFKQGREIILKITDDFMLKSPLLRNEIDSYSIGQNECAIRFKNGSWMRVAIAGEGSRGIRSTAIAVDETRLVDQKIIDTILRPMNSSPRSPGYLNNPEYAHLKEVPQEYYLSSAYYCQSELYEKVKAYTANMLTDGLKYFVCDLPYQLSIKEGILLRQTIENEMSEATFSNISFLMERAGIFWGSSEDALFDYKVIQNRRILDEGLHLLDYYRFNGLKVPEKKKGEVRILSVDVALMATRKHDNDASALIIHSGIPTPSHNYMDNVVLIDTQEGLVTDDLGLLIMRYYYQYNCDYIVLDIKGVGIPIGDYLMMDRYDSLYGQLYPALNFMNNNDMSERCKIKGAPKVIYGVQANQKNNNDMCLTLRAGFQNGYINLLKDDNQADVILPKVIKGFNKLTDEYQTMLKIPYIQTSLLINELVNLQKEVNNGYVKVKEKTGMRKDRYSSLEYGYFFLQELSKNLKPKPKENTIIDKFKIRKPQLRRYGLLG